MQHLDSVQQEPARWEDAVEFVQDAQAVFVEEPLIEQQLSSNRAGLRLWLPIAFEHCPRNLGRRRPEAARSAGIALILVECVHVRLHRSFTLHEDDANGVAWEPGNEALRILDHAADSSVQPGHVNRLLGRERLKLLHCETAVPDDFG
jgi:hypothetical protein